MTQNCRFHCISRLMLKCYKKTGEIDRNVFISWASVIFFWMTLLRSLGLMCTYRKCIPQLLPWNWKSCTISDSKFLMRLSESQSSWRRPTFSFKTGIKVAFWSPLTASEHLRTLASFVVFFSFSENLEAEKSTFVWVEAVSCRSCSITFHRQRK